MGLLSPPPIDHPLLGTNRELQAALGWALKHARELEIGESSEPSAESFERFNACCGFMKGLEKVGSHASGIARGCVRIQDILEPAGSGGFQPR